MLLMVGVLVSSSLVMTVGDDPATLLAGLRDDVEDRQAGLVVPRDRLDVAP